MHFWNQYPFVRLLIAYLIGLFLAVYLPYNISIAATIIAIIFLFLFAFFYKKIVRQYSYRWIFGIIVFISVATISFTNTFFQTEKNKPNFFARYYDETASVIAIVDEPIVEKKLSNRTIASVVAISKSSVIIPASGKLMVYFEKDTLSDKIQYGDLILIASTIQEVNPPLNPHQFDYKNYLEKQGIYHQAYCKTNDWKLLDKKQGNIFKHYAIQARDFFLQIFKRYNILNESFSIAAALILGYTDTIEPEMMRHFSRVGAMHILSVSGLHVGVIYLLIHYLLFFFNRFKHGNYIKAILSIVLIWFYASITGLAPSVVRASCMLSFVIIGNSLQRHPSIFNSIAFSAFVILFFEPYAIFHIGFQLSYIALLGIVIFQKPIASVWRPNFKPLVWLRDLISVSIAAQIATFPIGIFYFKIFPSYFILTNIFAIPLSSLIIYAGILLFIFSPFNIVAQGISLFFYWIIHIFQQGIQYISALPAAVIDNIQVHWLQVILLYLFIVFISIWIYKKRHAYFFAALTALFFCLLIWNLLVLKAFQQKEFITYQVKKNSIIDFFDGFKVSTYIANTKEFNNTAIENSIEPNRLYKRVIAIDTIPINSPIYYKNNIFFRDHFLQFYDLRIAIVSPEQIKYSNSSQKPINVDYLVLSNNPKCKLQDIMQQYHVKKQVIIDGSNTYQIKKWKDEAQKLHIPLHFTAFSGAFYQNIKF